MGEQRESADQWKRLGWRCAFRRNAAWLFDWLIPALSLVMSLGAVAILLWRGAGKEIDPIAGVAWLGGVSAAVVAAVFRLRMRGFESRSDALVRIEGRMGLHNRLTSAERGVAAWPSVPESADDGLRWRPVRVWLPVLVAAACWVAAMKIPLGAHPAPGESAPAMPEPSSWKRLEASIDLLEKSKVLDEGALQRVRETVEKLRSRDEGEWFSHASLEATDRLEEEFLRMMRGRAVDLKKFDRLMSLAERVLPELPEPARNALDGQMGRVLEGLAGGRFPMNPELLDALKHLDFQQLQRMDPGQFENLRRRMAENLRLLRRCQGGRPGEGEDDALTIGEGDELDDEDLLLLAGIARGPGTAPIELGEATDLGTENIEGVANPDMSHAAPSETLGVTTGTHEVEERRIAPYEAGEANSLGKGGGEVWRNTLLPEEQSLMERYLR